MGGRGVNGGLLALLALLAAGAGLATQAPINAALSRSVGDAAVAACINFLVGFLVLLAVCALRGVAPAAGFLAVTPAWAWIGGTFGATYILALTWSVPQVGALTAAAATIFAQLVAALLLDRLGAFGLPVQEITWPRVLGVVLVLGGLFLTRI